MSPPLKTTLVELLRSRGNRILRRRLRCILADRKLKNHLLQPLLLRPNNLSRYRSQSPHLVLPWASNQWKWKKTRNLMKPYTMPWAKVGRSLGEHSMSKARSMTTVMLVGLAMRIRVRGNRHTCHPMAFAPRLEVMKNSILVCSILDLVMALSDRFSRISGSCRSPIPT